MHNRRTSGSKATHLHVVIKRFGSPAGRAKQKRKRGLLGACRRATAGGARRGPPRQSEERNATGRRFTSHSQPVRGIIEYSRGAIAPDFGAPYIHRRRCFLASKKDKHRGKPGYGVPQVPDGGLGIFTDGSMLNKPRRGGYGFVLVWTDEDGEEATEPFAGQGFANATINQMELLACTDALETIQRPYMKFDLAKMTKVKIFTDSMYVADHWQRARTTWKPQKWFNSDGRPIDNAPEWKEFVKQVEKLQRAGVRVEVEWAKGHSALNKHNKTADELAGLAAESSTSAQLRPVNPGKKLTKHPTVRGSVGMEGQEITIRIIDHMFNSATGTTRYRYEVMDPLSEYDQRSDFIYSTLELHRWQTYRVVVSDDPKNPEIAEVLETLEVDADSDAE